VVAVKRLTKRAEGIRRRALAVVPPLSRAMLRVDRVFKTALR
jgi:hypothetical protein